MRTIWIVVWSICFSTALLWLPSGVGADPTTGKCADIGDKMWGPRSQPIPKNQATIDMLTKLAVDCPAIAGSMERLARDMKAHLQKQAEARKDLQQLPIYNPGAINPVAGSMGF
jgi:hypothetical protein